MSFDGIVTRAVVDELKSALVGGRIDKVYQQEKDEIQIQIYNKGKNHRLLISASSNNPRIYLTQYSKKNPESPPVFCMFLRKHLIGGIILNVEQYLMDRIVVIDLSSLDELGLPIEKRLLVEIMGKHSNIILINKENGKILDSIKRVHEDMSRIRQILPAIKYQYPPSQDKRNPLETDREEFFNLLSKDKAGIQIYKFIYFNYMGLSPLVSKEICFRANIDIDRSLGSLNDEEKEELYVAFSGIVKDLKNNNYKPLSVYDKEETMVAFYSLDLEMYNSYDKKYEDSISRVLDNYYRKKDIEDRIRQKSQAIRKAIQARLERTKNKLAKQKEELLDSQSREKYKIYADLISANIYRIPKGADQVELENFYDENMTILTVPLDPKLTAAQNAQRYYKRFSKLKTAEKLLLDQIPETEEEVLYFENILFSLENVEEIQELDEIREELIKEGYIKDTSRSRKKRKDQEAPSKPYHYISSDGFSILVGKNNRQNEQLTLRTARKEDIWLHVKDMPGSHVIIRRENKEVPESTLMEAAVLAAYYSKGKNSSLVDVDYTEKKNVRKPNKAKPGMVIYENYNTITVKPDRGIVNKLELVES